MTHHFRKQAVVSKPLEHGLTFWVTFFRQALFRQALFGQTLFGQTLFGQTARLATHQKAFLLWSIATIVSLSFGVIESKSTAAIQDDRVSGEQVDPSPPVKQQNSQPLGKPDAGIEQLQSRIEEIIEVADRSVVSIARVSKDELEDPTSPNFIPKQFGTGVVIAENGLILTCYHLLGDTAKHDYYVWFAGKPYLAREVEKVSSVLAADPWTDLAVLKIDAKLQPIRLAQNFVPRRGKLVVALGNPFGIARDGNASASLGIISNLSRQRTFQSASELRPRTSEAFSQYGTLLQTDAKLNLGTSGGPLLNLDGEMIGLTSALAAADRYDTAAGFAIPVDETFRRTVETLRRGRSADFGFLGIATRELDVAQRQQVKKGVVVTQVVDNTPADSCGLKFGDVISEINGKKIGTSSELLRELSGRFAGDEIRITIWRKPFPETPFRKMDLKAKLGKKKVRSQQPTIGLNDFSDWRGLKIDYSTAIEELAQHNHKIDPKGCVAITAVSDGSAAARAGLKSNEFISHVGGQRVTTPQQFFTLVNKEQGPVVLQLTQPKSESTKTRSITIE